MSESKKMLIGFSVIAMICICVMGVTYFSFRRMGEKMETIANGDPATVAKVQKRIANFDVPEGYKPVGMSFLGYDMINLIPEHSSSSATITMIQYNGLISDQAQMEQQLHQMAEQQSGMPGGSSTVVETYEETIRGETVEVTVTETSFEGVTIRQWMTLFEGNKGPTLLMIQDTVGSWDDQFVDDFIASIE